MTQETLDLLQRLTDANGVTGFEGPVARIMAEQTKDICEVSYDRLGSVICRLDGGAPSPKVMLAGHLDEIGFMAKLVTEKGFVRFTPLGGWWGHVLLAQPVVIDTHKGPVIGVIASKPPHILPQEKRKDVLQIRDMFIDVGAKDREEATEVFGIRPGDPITPLFKFTRMANPKLLLAKAWDDRVAVALAVDAVKELQGTEHPNTVYAVGTAQEEVGLRGAQTAVQTVNPDVALVLEVGIAGDVPNVEEWESTVKLGGGVALYIIEGSALPNMRLRDLAIEVCGELGICCQLTAMEGGGTDAGKIHVHAQGVPSLVIGVPCRHIHAHSGIIHSDDYDDALKLVVALCRRLDAETVAGLAPR
jgi:putative aminopeptidase FrvX